MNKAQTSSFTLLVLLTIAGFATINIHEVQASPAQEVRAVPLLTRWEDAGLGETFQVDIEVTCEAIDGLQLDLRFNTETLNVTEVVEGPIIPYPNWVTINTTVTESLPLNLGMGQVLYAGATIGASQLTASGVALTITFNVTKERGSSVLRLEPGRVSGSGEAATEEGNVFVTGYGPSVQHIFPKTFDAYYGSPILLYVKRSKISVGEDLEFNGTIIGVSEETDVALLYRREGETTWTNQATVRSNATGYFEYVWEKPSAGKYEVKATATIGGSEGESIPLTVIVEAPPLDIWLIVGIVIIVVVAVAVLVYYFKVIKKRGAQKAVEAREAAEEAEE